MLTDKTGGSYEEKRKRMEKSSRAPVSYTHLDVYKRQIVFPDRSVILYVRDLSEKNAGQKYRYQILFKLRSGNDIELILYSRCV